MAPTWEHVLTIECMRTTTYPSEGMHTHIKTKNSLSVVWLTHPLSIYRNPKMTTNLEVRILRFFKFF
jgi:hypothetical protein